MITWRLFLTSTIILLLCSWIIIRLLQMLVFERNSARARLILMIDGSCLVLVLDTHLLYTILYYLLHQAMKTSFVLCSFHRLVQMP